MFDMPASMQHAEQSYDASSIEICMVVKEALSVRNFRESTGAIRWRTMNSSDMMEAHKQPPMCAMKTMMSRRRNILKADANAAS